MVVLLVAVFISGKGGLDMSSGHHPELNLPFSGTVTALCARGLSELYFDKLLNIR